MLNRQFGLLVMVALLISPNLAQANQVDGTTDLSVGNVRIQTTPNGTKVQTPGVQIDSPKSTENRVAVSRTTRRRSRVAPVRRSRTSTPLILNKKVSTDSKTTVTTTTSPGSSSTVRTTTTTSSPENSSVRTTTTRNAGTIMTIKSSPNSTVRRTTTIRNSNIDNDNDSETINEQQQSTSCSGGSGTVVQSSSSTVNGRTVSSQSRSNCN